MNVTACVLSDLHLEAGGSLGRPDADLGNTRLADARRILGKIMETPCDVLLFLGDLARGPRPGPVAYSIAAEAFARSPAKRIVLLQGNHDFGGERYSCLHVLADSLPNAEVVTTPKLLDIEGLQVGCLPWTPPNRLFDKAPHQPRKMSRLVAERLVDIARGLSQELDPARPSILIAHWLIAGEKLLSGIPVMETREPLIPAADLEASTDFDLAIAGHNHRRQVLSETIFCLGPPMRGGWGEQDAETGFGVVTWP
jgi:DNA repair exonuclease SbcCD nuclease subunit